MCHIYRCHYAAQPLVDWRRNVWNNCVWISAISFELRKIKLFFSPDFTLIRCVYNRCCMQYSSFWWCKRRREMSRVVVFCWCFRFVQSQCDVLPRLLYVVLCWVIVCQIFGRHVMYMCAASSQSSFVPYRIKWTRLNGAMNNWNSRQIESIYRMWVRNDVF